MTRRDIVQLGCRIVAAFFFMLAITEVTRILYWLITSGSSIYADMLGVGYLLEALFAVLLWLFSDRLGKAIMPDDGPNAEVTGLSRWDFVFVAVVAIGLYFAVTGLPDVLTHVIRALTPNPEPGLGPVLNVNPTRIAESAAKLVVGLALFYWCKEVSALIERPRPTRKSSSIG